MTVIAVQAPVAPYSPRIEAATPSAFALSQVQTVPALPNSGVQLQMSDPRGQGKPPAAAAMPTPAPISERAPPRTIDPFPAVRFADPLPDLPDLETAPPANPYSAALNVVRGVSNR